MHFIAAGSSAAKGIVFALGGVAGANAVVVAQVVSESTGTLETIVPAAALTASTGALGYVVKQFAGGKLVHRDPAASESNLAALAAGNGHLAENNAHLVEKGLERERILLELMLNRNPKP